MILQRHDSLSFHTCKIRENNQWSQQRDQIFTTWVPYVVWWFYLWRWRSHCGLRVTAGSWATINTNTAAPSWRRSERIRCIVQYINLKIELWILKNKNNVIKVNHRTDFLLYWYILYCIWHMTLGWILLFYLLFYLCWLPSEWPLQHYWQTMETLQGSVRRQTTDCHVWPILKPQLHFAGCCTLTSLKSDRC